MNEKAELEIQQIRATITNLNAETEKLLKESKYEHWKVLAYVVATFSAAFFLAFKVAGVI